MQIMTKKNVEKLIQNTLKITYEYYQNQNKESKMTFEEYIKQLNNFKKENDK